MRIFGYARVSSKTQLEGNGLEAQKKEILAKYDNATMYMEQFTGKTTGRPIFNEVLGELSKDDMLVVSKLDRLARNTVEGIQIIEGLFSKGIAVHVLNIGILENTNMGKFFLTTLLAIAEMERSTILERTQAGKEIARQNPEYREGRPKEYTDSQYDWCIELLKENSIPQVAKKTGISESSIKRELRKRGLTVGDIRNKFERSSPDLTQKYIIQNDKVQNSESSEHIKPYTDFTEDNVFWYKDRLSAILKEDISYKRLYTLFETYGHEKIKYVFKNLDKLEVKGLDRYSNFLYHVKFSEPEPPAVYKNLELRFKRKSFKELKKLSPEEISHYYDILHTNNYKQFLHGIELLESGKFKE
jgi:DNA invertase Pin-like site-specific DNA recombinase